MRGRCADRLDQLRLLAERGVVHQCGDLLAVLLDERDAAAATRLGQCRRIAVLIGPAAVLRQPVDQGQGGIAQRLRQQFPEVWCRVGPELDQKLSDTCLGEAGIEKSCKEGEWRQPGDCEGCQPDDLEAWKLERAGNQQGGEHDQRQAEAVDHDLGRSPPLPPWQ